MNANIKSTDNSAHQKTPNFFTEGSPFLSHPLLSQERTRNDINFIISNTTIPSNGSVLDIGCGYGRHSIELSKRGYSVTGIDPAKTMIEEARKRSNDLVPPPKFIQLNAEDLETDINFDAAICLFNTLGQINDHEVSDQIVRNISKLLKKSGELIIELPNPNWVYENFIPMERIGSGQRYVDVERVISGDEKVVTEIFNVTTPQHNKSFVLRYRLFQSAEIKSLLSSTGFEKIKIFGGPSGGGKVDTSHDLFYVARKK